MKWYNNTFNNFDYDKKKQHIDVGPSLKELNEDITKQFYVGLCSSILLPPTCKILRQHAYGIVMSQFIYVNM